MLYHKLGAPIGISWRKREALSNRDRSGVTIYRGRRGEDHIPNPGLLHRRQQNERAPHIVIVILQRLIDRLTHCLEAGEVQYGNNRMDSENLVQAVTIPDISVYKRWLRRTDLLQPL